MSELVLYVLATIVVLAGVAYFFVKQREQEALLANKSRSRGSKQQSKGKKEPKETEKKEKKEAKLRKPSRPPKDESAPAPKKKAIKEEDETKSVLDFLKNQKFTSDKTEKGAQAKVRSAPNVQEKKAPAPKFAKPESSSSGSDSEEGDAYTVIKRKAKTPKEKADGATPDEEGKPASAGPTKKNKYFTMAEKKAADDAYLARKAEKEARKNRPPGEKRERKPRPEEGDPDFEAYRERRQRNRERRKQAEEGAEEGAEGEERPRKPKFEPREPDAPPIFASSYETADIDNILNNLTSYYNANPEANRVTPRNQPVAASADSADAE